MPFVLVAVVSVCVAVWLFGLRPRGVSDVQNEQARVTALFVVAEGLFSVTPPTLGTIVDSLPSLAGACYILMSRRVRNTFALP